MLSMRWSFSEAVEEVEGRERGRGVGAMVILDDPLKV
jgi:hypothetical protein